MRWLRKMSSMFSYGVDSFLMRDVEPAVVNYTHFTCVVAELLLIWKKANTQDALFFALVFLFHFWLFFRTGYRKGNTYGAEERAIVRHYQVEEAFLIFFGAMIQPESMLCYVVCSYGLPYVMAKVVEFLMTVPAFGYFEYVVFVLLHVVVWAPAVLFGILLAYAGFSFVWTAIGLIVYFAALPFIISFEDDYANLYEIAFNRFV